MIIKEIYFDTDEYNKSVILRDKILRKPLGLVFTEEFLADDKFQFHIGAFINNEIIGILILKPLNKNVMKMRQVAVSENFQKQGIGKKMVKFAEKFASDKGYKSFELNARNEAIKFYRSMNYKTIGNEFLEVGIKHQKMIKIFKD